MIFVEILLSSDQKKIALRTLLQSLAPFMMQIAKVKKNANLTLLFMLIRLILQILSVLILRPKFIFNTNAQFNKQKLRLSKDKGFW